MHTLGLGLSELERYSDAQAVFRTTLHGDAAHVAAALQLAAMSQQLGSVVGNLGMLKAVSATRRLHSCYLTPH